MEDLALVGSLTFSFGEAHMGANLGLGLEWTI